MKLIVGLGNPGKEYEKTRHNAGFMAIDEIAKELSVEINQKKFKALYVQAKYKGESVILLKPQTYMNLSGEAVGECARFYNIGIDDILVLVDDLDLPVGKIRLREKGSSGGQKGLKSIMAHLGSEAFKRIRIGIDKDQFMLTADYVLGKIPKRDLEEFNKAKQKATEAALAFIHLPFSDVMNHFNKKDA